MIYEVTLDSGPAEATMLVEAHDPEDAEDAAWDRVLDGDVCWEGYPTGLIRITSVVEHENLCV